LSLHVEIRGDGPDLVLLHGWGLHGGMWGPWLDALTDVARLHVLDLPGHGRSGFSPSQGDLPGMARAVFARLPSGATVLGWSLGGLIALELARRHPRQVHALILIASTPRFLAGPDWEHGMQPEVLDEFSAGLERDYHRTVQNFLTLQTRGDERGSEALRELRHRLGDHGEPDRRALAAGLDMLRRTDLRDALPRIVQPALVIAGEHDRLTPPAAGRELAATLPSARLRVIERCGHAPFLSHAEPVIGEVRGFLARRQSAGAA
jgi:pimeloyl-[acyl-carrier protein] methyl ester esterase